MRFLNAILLIATTLWLAALSGCMVGPNFHLPPPPDSQTYTPVPLPAKTTGAPGVGPSGKRQYFVAGMDIPGEWWGAFHSPLLQDLIYIGLVNNPTLVAAEAALRQAQEAVLIQFGNTMLPAVNGEFFAERQRFAGASLGAFFPSTLFNNYFIAANLSYTPDVWGGARRQLQALRAQVNYQDFQLKAAYLTLTTNIVITTVTIASLNAQITTTQQLIQAEQKILHIQRKQLGLGGISGSDVLTQATLVAQTMATLPPLRKNLAAARDALSVLLGVFPDSRLAELTNLDTLALPTQLPVSVPSDLVRQRPDVRAAEALLHAASAQIGVATANLLPQFTLTGDYGRSSPILPMLFDPIDTTWFIMGQVLQPLFHGGALRAARRQAVAAYDQAAAQYRQTILQALQSVADALQAVNQDASTLRADVFAEKYAYKNWRISKKQYQLGGVSYLTLLNAQQQYLQNSLARIQAQAQRYNDTATLFAALGGGWWNVFPTLDREGLKLNWINWP